MLTKLAGGCVAALVLGLLSLGISGPAAAEPTKIEEIRGSKLVVYKEATGAPLKRIPAKDVHTPLDILGISPKGRYQVEINGEVLWIPKAQAVTNEVTAGPAVSCQSLTTSYASSRGFADCEKKK